MPRVKKLTSPPPADDLEHRVRQLGLYGILANWDEVKDEPWLTQLVDYEEVERQKRSLERRLRNSKVGRFKPIADFEWDWPSKIDRSLIEDLFSFEFISDQSNVILLGPNGVGKTTLARNLAYEALMRGHTVRCATASEVLNDLAAADGRVLLSRRLHRYTSPSVLLIDEVGYLSYDSHHADLLFEIVSRRHQQKSTIITTNRPFQEWNEVFPNSSCVVALVDRLVHKAEIVTIEGQSYRLKESQEHQSAKKRRRSSKKERETDGT